MPNKIKLAPKECSLIISYAFLSSFHEAKSEHLVTLIQDWLFYWKGADIIDLNSEAIKTGSILLERGFFFPEPDTLDDLEQLLLLFPFSLG